MREELFLKNTQALFEVDEFLACTLRSLKYLTFALIQDENGINFKKDDIFLYENPNKELLENLTLFKTEYNKYPVLFFYGFGNGMFYKTLCKNKQHKHIIIFEDNLEILTLAFHLFDFSEELKKEQLILFYTPNINTAQLTTLFTYEIIQKSVKIFNLFIHNDFYQQFYSTQIQNINTQLIEMIRFIVLNKGNDPHDSLVGIKHTLDNLPKMLNHGIFQEFLKERRAKVENAIIVSTGPSLIKQLPLLKKYANKATIFCADSSYPILAKHGIKPDYVCMLERTEITAEFFNNDFWEFDKDIVFVCAGVVHPKAIEYLKGKTFIITQKVLAFPYYINLKDFSYTAVGLSVAHTLSYLATYLSHKNIIFIGQDLAYAENGNSHPDDYQNSANYESQMYEHILTIAYGGNGKVETHSIWLLFKNWFENEMIPNTRKMGITTYNCTEGGARIEGTIEKPFLWACENLLHKDLNKPFEKLEPLSLNKQNEFLLKAYYKVYQSIKHCRDFSKILSNDFEKIQSVYLSLNEKEEYLNLAIEKIDEFKNKLEDIKQMQDLYEILQPLRTQFELNLARIYILNPKTKEDAFNKSILWIKEHLEFMELVYGHIKAQENALIKNILPLEEKLKERKLDKWMERVRR
ncbi:TPA: motility associated factor glycosyltransferase family protein [Campylobacter jejuni]